MTPSEIVARGRGSRAAPAAGPVPILPGVHRGWPWTRGIVLAHAGTILQGPDGTTIRIRPDGGADELLEVPRRWSVSADPTAPGMRSSANGRGSTA